MHIDHSVYMQSALMLVEMEAMKVRNAEELALGKPPVYKESDFRRLPVTYGFRTAEGS
jgi:hypothetical protein